MKIKNLILLTFALFAMSFQLFAQEEQAEAPMFGNTRSFAHAKIHDFKVITGKPASFQFTIKNEGKTKLHITDVEIPEKIGVTLVNKTAAPGEDAVIIATVDPTVAPQGTLKETIVVTTEQKEPGIKTTKQMKFLIQAQIK